MITQSHSLIGKIVFSAISEHTEVKLVEHLLKYGCIKPDLTPRLRAIPHFKDKSFDFITYMIEEMRSRSLPESKRQLEMLSINLGVIMHYIADYFCYAHNNEYYNSLLPHFIYESGLAMAFASADLEKIRNDAVASVKQKHIVTKKWLREYIEKRHREYVNCKRSMETDISYSVEACVTVAYVIIASCVMNSKEAAA
ncbi:MAG: zinc dependent phospholipase C family protein [Clostridiaceae bacterium]|nr:zinc dependent phospholipase C family protein [Clostridiaceae bacterium]